VKDAAGAPEEAPPPEREPGSFRDRNGRVFYRDGRVFRSLSPRALANWRQLQETAFFVRRVGDGSIVATTDRGLHAGGGLLEHARIPFVSYPYEWTFGMLKDAALLHLELMQDALAEGFILKDASPYNVQWRGARPVFIDVPSFEPLGHGEPWVGYRQFCELMLYPLMLQAYRGIDFRPWLRGRIDGIPAEEMDRLMSSRDLLRRGVLLHVAAQRLLQRRYAGGRRNVRGALADAGFGKGLIQKNVAKLTRLIRSLTPPRTPTEWADYDRTHSYDPDEHAAKAAFVRRAAETRRWRLAWDLGCNTGTFAKLVEPHAGHIVAMDADWMAVERLYARERADPHGRVLPLVVNLADASPAQGWRGAERKDLASRGAPDLVLCLALVHHVAITANIPLADLIDWLASLGASVVIEFVGREDEMVEALLANRVDQYDDYTLATFRGLLAEKFRIRDEAPLKSGRRTIFFVEPVQGTA
jgi:SAM-dependent methyltransferase